MFDCTCVFDLLFGGLLIVETATYAFGFDVGWFYLGFVVSLLPILR